MNSTFDKFLIEAENTWRILNTDVKNYDLPLLRSPLPPLLLCNAYLLFVLKLGPAYMKSRQPYDLKKLMLIYNLLQVVLNFYGACWGFYAFFWLRPYDLSCIQFLPNDHQLKSKEVYLSYLFYLLKFFDLFDTIFFILRKKSNQVSFLHVYHHYITSTLAVVYIKFVGLGGHSMIFGFANFIVHTVMYSYYFLSILKPKNLRLLWWKHYITQIQILQFVILVLHNGWPLVMNPDCDHPKWILLLAVTQFSLMIFLFVSFYRRAYLKTNSSVKEQSIEGVKGMKLHNVGEKLD